MLKSKKGSSNSNTLILVLILFALFINYTIFSKIITNKVPPADYSKYKSEEKDEGKKNEAPDKSELIKKDVEQNFTDITASKSDTECGELILVNKTHKFNFDAKTSLFPQEFPESIFESKTDNYYVKNINISLNKTATLALNDLLDDFYKETGHSDIIIVDAFRSYETQQIVLDAKIEQYGEEQGRLIATEPGASEHHSGYAIDLSLYIDKTQQDYDGTGDYTWITDNCYKYGFVIRYPEGKTDVTGIDYEPWHLRYVGKPHAYYMAKNNLCLEEYVDKLSYYPVDSERLNITTDTGDVYEVYSAPVDGDSATVKVPKNGEYTLSGDNSGHIIVTIHKSGNDGGADSGGKENQDEVSDEDDGDAESEE